MTIRTENIPPPPPGAPMSLDGHVWMRNGWYRSISLPAKSQLSWIKRVSRLAKSGLRAQQMGLQFMRLEYGGVEQQFLDRALDI